MQFEEPRLGHQLNLHPWLIQAVLAPDVGRDGEIAAVMDAQEPLLRREPNVAGLLHFCNSAIQRFCNDLLGTCHPMRAASRATGRGRGPSHELRPCARSGLERPHLVRYPSYTTGLDRARFKASRNVQSWPPDGIGACQNDGMTKRKDENVVQRVGDILESRFLAAAEVATSTTSAEENLASAVVEAIEGHRDQNKPAKPRKARPVKAKRRRR